MRNVVIVWICARYGRLITRSFDSFNNSLITSMKITSRISFFLEKYRSFLYSTWVFFHCLKWNIFLYLQTMGFPTLTRYATSEQLLLQHFLLSGLILQSSWLVPDFSEPASLLQLQAGTVCATWDLGFCMRGFGIWEFSVCIYIYIYIAYGSKWVFYFPSRHQLHLIAHIHKLQFHVLEGLLSIREKHRWMSSLWVFTLWVCTINWAVSSQYFVAG